MSHTPGDPGDQQPDEHSPAPPPGEEPPATAPYGVPPQPGDGTPPGYPAPPGYAAPPPPGYGYPAPPPGYGYPPGPGYVPPGQPGGYLPGYMQVPVRPDHPSATKALVLGIVALAGGFTCYLPILVGPWAWVVGRRTVREIDADPERWGGRSQAFAGYVLGVIATVLLVIGVLVIAGFLAILVASSVGSGTPAEPVPGGTSF
ncbi:DUF4190 domain-containing protein [Nocardioides mesophilus]|uniref:DUF4190 domain-containing protein n=1 Tax=Nocardioides mesophilus TaxID=433659 RepID=A0A7G9R6X5_9ACTN|nr:DUF4190 domain-containing protein [Nocardioides mesophilus]QNN51350.1 DUF4190 domain-containing protein [Nocardioides mesophilus]